eukprot:CAMPEP_0178421902 /NCGR_PEP_ID=MMETSP0689_2-20121128/26891_1 /TAXON_ID=160604 /ORGANISM="Amphidinium massartii, Strain CS-259" /LENGTH=333 /DNA_ID=CAMNT_0020043437 /DNA_START=95 /DNA_END=1096 /DNA_ORIENTATION=+
MTTPLWTTCFFASFLAAGAAVVDEISDATCHQGSDSSAGKALLQMAKDRSQEVVFNLSSPAFSFLDLVLNGHASAAEEAEFASFLRDPSDLPLAIVGNGPLEESDRAELNKFPAKQIFRMNAMNNLREGEPVGHVYANSCSQGWWGVTTLICPKIKEAEEIVLFGEPEKARANLMKLREKWGEKVFLGLADGHELHIDGRNFSTRAGNGGFSIGFKSIAYTRWRYPNAKLSIFGMNWSPPKSARGHPFEIESQAINQLLNVEIHATPKNMSWHGDHDFLCVAATMPKVAGLIEEYSGPVQEFNSEDAWSLWAGESLPDQCEDVDCGLKHWMRQ